MDLCWARHARMPTCAHVEMGQLCALHTGATCTRLIVLCAPCAPLIQHGAVDSEVRATVPSLPVHPCTPTC